MARILKSSNLKLVNKLLSHNYTTKTIVKSNYDHTIDIVKTNDFNTYLSTLLTPEHVLRAAFAVKALNIELLSIIKTSSDTKSQISRMKLQFWKVST